MCGIAGFWELKAERSEAELKSDAERMALELAHRGPDGMGTWADEKLGIAFGHRRLSIIDLTDAGSQPMISSNKRFIITFNGEIYNFQELRKELENIGIKFIGHSDTEVLLEAISNWGLEKTLIKSIGMFAFALWDRNEQKLSLVRDRLGVKPLYYHTTNDTLLFSSQSKSFLKHPDFHPTMSLETLTAFLSLCYIPQSRSIYENTAQVPPGHIIHVLKDGTLKKVCYWSIPRGHITINENEALERLENIMENATKIRMRSDVPLGAFISGGIDSSTIAALMQYNNPQKIKTFCVGFAEGSLDESKFAKAVANHLNTDHTEIIMHERDILSLIPELPKFYDEPFADPSMLPTMLVSKVARKFVTVCLSGDGGDELFAGYRHYKRAHILFSIPQLILNGMAPIIRNIPFQIWKSMGNVTGINITSRRIERFNEVVSAKNKKDLIKGFYGNVWPGNILPLIDGQTNFDMNTYMPDTVDSVEDMQRFDATIYLPDDILTKVDRASMAFGLEVREPLLDHRLAEFAFSLPLSFKIKGKVTKYLLRKLLYKHIPQEMIDRPKQGFSPPICQWLRGPLKDWAEDLINTNNLNQSGILDEKKISRIWQEHISEKHDHSSALWNVLMFQSWKKHYSI